MKPLTQLYWIRTALGVVAGFISAALALVQDPNSIYTLVNSVTAAVAIYLITYYVLRATFKNKVEQQSKITMMGIGMYFFAWLAFFVLFYTILRVAFPIPI
jgi:zinc transporter ZupT